jgi:hypothetical protein
MMIPEAREFCFDMFFSFFIIMTFFFMRHPSGRSFFFREGNSRYFGLTSGIFFYGKYARPQGKRKISGKTRQGNEYAGVKRYHTFALMNRRPAIR